MQSAFLLSGGGEIQTQFGAGVRWTPAATSENTGGYNKFIFPLREDKLQIESTIPTRHKVP